VDKIAVAGYQRLCDTCPPAHHPRSMGKTASEKQSAGARPSRASDGTDASASGASTPGEPTEPLERARLQAEVARQRVRIAKEELKRARKRMKEAKREAKRARKQAAAARKVWKKARKAHRENSPPQSVKRSARGARHKSTRRRRAVRTRPDSQADGSTPVNSSSET